MSLPMASSVGQYALGLSTRNLEYWATWLLEVVPSLDEVLVLFGRFPHRDPAETAQDGDDRIAGRPDGSGRLGSPGMARRQLYFIDACPEP